jgi:hypothetical protein
MRMKRGVYSNNQFKDGRDHSQPEYLIPDTACYEMDNWLFDVTGMPSTRLGYTVFNETEATAVTSFVSGLRYYDSDGTTYKTFLYGRRTTADSIWVNDDAAGTLTILTSGSTLTAGGYCDIVAWKDTVFFANGTEAIQLWTSGTTKADITGSPSPPVVRYLEVHLDRLYGVGTTLPNRLYYSDVGDETDWPTNNYMDVGINDGGYIVGLKELGQALFIIKTSGVWALYGNSGDAATAGSFNLIPVPGVPGCTCPRSIVKVPGGLMWVSNQDIIVFNGETFEHAAPEKIRDILDTFIGAAAAKVAGGYHDRRYYLSYQYTGSSNNDRVAVFDFKTQGWSTINSTWPIASFIPYVGIGDDLELMAGSSTGGYMYQLLSGYLDGSTAITATLETKHLDFGKVGIDKHFKDIIVSLDADDQAATLTITPIKDLDTYYTSVVVPIVSGELWDVAIMDEDTFQQGNVGKYKMRIPNPAKGRLLALKIVHTSSAGQAYFRGWDVYFDYLPEGRPTS